MDTNVSQDQTENLMSSDDEHEHETKSQFELGIRMRIDQLIRIDTANQRYELAAVFDKTWIATKEDISASQKDAKNYTPQIIPKVDLKNCIDTANIRYQKWTTENVYRCKKSLNDNHYYNCQRMKFTGNFTEEFEVHNFPFDVQSLAIVIAPSSTPSKDFKFVPDTTHSDYIAIDKTWSSATDWDIVNVGARTTDIDLLYARTNGKLKGKDKDIYPYIVFRIQVQRKWKAVFFTIVIWMFMLGLLSFCIFGYEASNLDGRLSFAITMVLTIVAFQFIIQQQLPKVSYLTLIDKYNFSIFMLVLLQSIESVFVGYQTEGLSFIPDNQIFDTYFMYGIAGVFAVGHMMFPFYCWRKYLFEEKKIKTYRPLKVTMLARFREDLDETNEFRKLVRD